MLTLISSHLVRLPVTCACYEIGGKFQLTTFNLPTHLIYVFDVVKSSLEVFWFIGIEL